MLIHLSIRNFALIRELDADFGEGLHIVTGETGAGKSILLGALGLVLGERADSKSVLENKDKCVIEAEFDIRNYGLQQFFSENDLDYADTTIIRREISSQGKSRSFVNDTPAQLSVLKELGEKLVDIHSQHETISLTAKRSQVEIIDSFAGAVTLHADYLKTFRKFRQLQLQYKELKEKETQIRSEYDYHAFLLNELSTANLKEGEQEEHEKELQVLENATDIAQAAFSSSQLLKSGEKTVLDMLNEVRSTLKGMIKTDPRFTSLFERINSTSIELNDIANELEEIGENTNADEARLEALNDRLSQIYQLQKKHRVETIRELLEIQYDLESKVERIEKLDDELKALESDVTSASEELMAKGMALSEKRRAQLPLLEKSMGELLQSVGMPNAFFTADIKPGAEPGEFGIDSIELLFTSNAGSAPQPVNKVASGGELSRLMLCLKSLLAANIALPTLVFDEIDTGISGEVAAKVGKLMKKVAEGHQVISITHLPQIAGQGVKHLYVYKEVENGKTSTRLRTLTGDERLTEIARMLSGDNPSASALANARELMLQ